MGRPLLFLETLGCPKNQADSRQVRGKLLEEGYAFTDEPQDAEIILLNTCGFIDEAKEESIQAILRLSRWKKKGRCRFLAVMGCLPQKYGSELEEALPEADLLLGVNDWEALSKRLGEYAERKAPAVKPEIMPPEPGLYRARWSVMEKSSPADYIKIAEGCHHRCTFCAIPQIRGGYRSRTPEDIIAEAAARAAHGLREAVLVAQDTGAYGRDLHPASSLAELVGSLCAVEGLLRIRIMYCYPEEVSDELIEAMKHPKVCPYLDMPMQHVDDDVLRRMGRGLGSEELKGAVRRLRESLPEVAIRTTLMVGFPGETEEAFRSLLGFLDEYRLERVGFFAFSPQPGTPAESLPGQVDEEIKERRLEAAQLKQARILAQRNDSLVGRVIPVMIDEETGMSAGRRYYEGRGPWDAPEIDGLVGFGSEEALAQGCLVNVRITHSGDYILSGEIADEPCQ
ncbi:MAG: 30S ribosomal protein S12 methylthiotransferase RimO [Clostridiales bacterium]|nr:30S ribosomal protein S12 methylthiotransferase RimO [Clostridiales bacterium]